MNSEYEYLKRNGSWSNPLSLSKDVAAAAAKLVLGHGPFSLTKNGKPVFDRKPRQVALTRLGRQLGDGRIGDVYRIRNGDGNIIFSTREVKPVPEVDPRRLELVKWAKWGVQHQGSIHYTQARPIPQYSKGHLPMYLDCSGSTITYCRWANIPDPSGGSYADGSTDNLLAYSKKIERRDLQLGDMTLWAYGSDGKHVAIVIELGADPLLASHGSEAGPLAIRLSAEDRYHASETLNYLSVLRGDA
jgi:hypothetical protein